MKTFIQRFDLISLTPNVRVNGENRFKNLFGGLLTIIYLVAMFVYSLVLIEKFLNRDNLISRKNEHPIYDPTYMFDEIPIFFQVYDQTGALIPEADRLYKIRAMMNIFTITYDNGEPQKNNTYVNLELKNCSKSLSEFETYKNLVEANYYQDKYCFSKSNKIKLEGTGGDGGNSTSIFITVEKCANTTAKSNCFPSNYINQALFKPMFAIRYLDFNINSLNPIFSRRKCLQFETTGDMLFSTINA